MGGGGGGGGGTGFFLQPATVTNAKSNATGTRMRLRVFNGWLLPQIQKFLPRGSHRLQPWFQPPFPTVKNSTVAGAENEKMAWPVSLKKTLSSRPGKHLCIGARQSRCVVPTRPLQHKPCLIFGNASMIMQQTGKLHRHSRIGMLVWPSKAHFQLQFGMKLFPVWVSCCCCVPSASIDQI